MPRLLNFKNPAASAVQVEWLPPLVGLSVLYYPTFYNLAAWHWRTEEGAHGPIIFALVAWLIWQRRDALETTALRTAPVAGFTLLVCGLLLYVLGRAHEIALFEVSAFAPILAGVVLAMRGWTALKVLWFPI